MPELTSPGGRGPKALFTSFAFVENCTSRLSIRRPRRLQEAASFTLVEMLVAIAVLSILLLLAAEIITRTSSIWLYSNSKMAEGREARVAFNSLVSRLSEATVDQYYGYTNYLSGGIVVPGAYVRRSELRFISGPSASINTTVANSPTDAVFFTAPLGIVSDTTDYGHLPSLLNICGYYIQWSGVDPEQPTIPGLSTTSTYRFRLMQFVQPSEQLSVYSQTIPFATNPQGNFPYFQFVTGTSWQNTAMKNSAATGVHLLADNVVALLLLPAMNTTDSSGAIAPGFLYDSENPTAGATTPALTSLNRTPPVMRVVMYTIDEPSAKRLAAQSTTMPSLYTGLFSNSSLLYPSTNGTDAGDLARFEQVLTANKLTYRRFDAAVQLPRQPWNTQN